MYFALFVGMLCMQNAFHTNNSANTVTNSIPLRTKKKNSSTISRQKATFVEIDNSLFKIIEQVILHVSDCFRNAHTATIAEEIMTAFLLVNKFAPVLTVLLHMKRWS